MNVKEKETLVLSVPEAGRLLGLSRATAYALANSGELPCLRLGRRLIVPKAALEKLLESAGKDNGGKDEC
ncbi:MAG: putative DNA-binding proteinA [Dehalococcoidia bacterium]|nr:putative DNA-binding proteinA [Bacillota bacterium]MBT9143006.1 putative DNA-binding proteinA [Bacillota bacterium]